MRDLQAFELEARRGKYAQIAAAQAADAERMAEIAQVNHDRLERITEAMGYLDAFRDAGDAEAFASAMEHWCRRPGFSAFVGPNGQMFLKQLIKAGDDGRGAEILRSVLYAPDSDEAARAALTRVLDFIQEVKKGGHPAPARTPFLLSFFWAMQDPQRWPVAWASATRSFYNLGWTQPGHDHAGNYLEFAAVARSLGDPLEVAHAMFWFDKHRFVGLAPSLVERCIVAKELADQAGARYETDDIRLAASYNSIALIFEVWMSLGGLKDELAEVMGRPVKLSYAKAKTGEHLYRWWGWASATPEGGNGSLRIWATRDGVLVGIHPGWAREGWYGEAGEIAVAQLPDGYEVFEIWDGEPGKLKPLGSAQPATEFLIGRFYPVGDALDRVGLGGEILDICQDLRPLADAWMTAAKAATPPASGDAAAPAPTAAVSPGPDDLDALVAEFRAQRGYPTPKDEQSKTQRAEWAEQLKPDQLAIADLVLMRQIISTAKYGRPGSQAVLNATLNALDAGGLERFFETIDDLLWGSAPLAERIDRVLDPAAGFKGLGESVIMKLLAIAHPDRVLPVFPYTGDMGKAKLMQLIGQEPPNASATRGEKQVLSNDAIRAVLEPHFAGDPWGQGQFLYWLRTRPASVEVDEGDAIGALAGELFLPPEELEDWVALLREKGQVVFYGPPGTGKTYVARKLAALLAGDPNRHRLVQFHPSTSYEDFFEGYRPETTEDGNLGYRLTPGPLARLAAQAEAAPGVDHIMVIDEINRANLPKVFGELLFLLEYRDEQVNTLYRSEDAFELPGNLLFIGTMNTADKSIALIDAALRRRFHFIPFFPHEEPHSQVLPEWLEEHNPDAVWVAGLVEHVNARLVELLGGPHLQIGASHFFHADLDEAKARRIWRYSIVPFIEDQLWGQTELLATFDFDAVLADYVAAGGEVPGHAGQAQQAEAGGGAADEVADGDPGGPGDVEP